MEKQTVGEFVISMYMVLPNSDRISVEKNRFKNVRISSYHGVTESQARDIKEEFIDLNSPFIAESQGSFVYEFKPYSTHI